MCAHCGGRLLSVEHIMGHCINFLNQRQRYHLNGKFMDVILGDEFDVDSHVGYLQAVKDFDM